MGVDAGEAEVEVPEALLDGLAAAEAEAAGDAAGVDEALGTGVKVGCGVELDWLVPICE